MTGVNNIIITIIIIATIIIKNTFLKYFSALLVEEGQMDII
jgi:hypothetical protein